MAPGLEKRYGFEKSKTDAVEDSRDLLFGRRNISNERSEEKVSKQEPS